MNNQLSQLLGLIKYEFKMHWRKRALLVILLTLIVVTVPVPLLIGDMSMVDNVVGDETAEDFEILQQGIVQDIADEQQSTTNSLTIQFFSWATLGIIMSMILPVTMADTIPLDRQLGVAELLESTPLRTSTYLVGKMVGMWVAVLSITLPLMCLSGIIWRVTSGPFELRGYLEMWLGSVTALIVINGSLGVLLPATQPTRRRAIMLVAGALFLATMFLPNLDPDTPMTLKDYLHPWRPPFFVHYMTGLMSNNGADIFLSVSVGLAQLTLILVAMWVWIRHRIQTA